MKCSICREKKITVYFNLFPFGSEGVNLCHECEMEVIKFIREKAYGYTRKLIEDKLHEKSLLQ